MYFVLFLRLLRVLYVRHGAGRPTLLLLAVALAIFFLVTTVRMVLSATMALSIL